MKKLIVIILLAAVLASCAAVIAFAQTTEEYVKELATEHEKVLSAECVIYQRACVIAIKTEKFATKSEYDAYVEKLSEQIKSECEVDHVLVSRSPKLMSKLAELSKLDETARNKAIEEIIKRELERHDNGFKRPIQPRFLTETR